MTLLGLQEQVEAFALDERRLFNLSQPLRGQLLGKTLLDATERDLRIPSGGFLRLRCFDQGTVVPSGFLRGLAASLSKSGSNTTTLPSVLYLPSWLRDSYSTLELADGGEDNFMIECQKRKIEVVFEEQPSSWLLDSEMSRNFRRRMRERRAREKNN
jgi:hypothetical protein